MKIFNTHLTDDDRHRVAVINQDVPGWSGYVHYGFFKAAFAAHDIKQLLILGVYRGRDIAYMLDILKRYWPTREISIIGVDRFTDQPCEDWPEKNKRGDWKSFGIAEAPDFGAAQRNLEPFRIGHRANLVLIQSDDNEYLAKHEGGFDMAYIDTSHDYETVKRQIGQCQRPGFLNEKAILCGDDYLPKPEWGVIRAVDEAWPNRLVLDNYIWVADL